MPSQPKFELLYAPIVKGHLKAIEAKYHSLIQREIEAQLLDEPDLETRNRKPLKRPIIAQATWEIRFGRNNRFRVLYKVNRSERSVEILGIGEKYGNRLWIGGQEIKL